MEKGLSLSLSLSLSAAIQREAHVDRTGDLCLRYRFRFLFYPLSFRSFLLCYIVVLLEHRAPLTISLGPAKHLMVIDWELLRGKDFGRRREIDRSRRLL
jgi:hypothetical protein